MAKDYDEYVKLTHVEHLTKRDLGVGLLCFATVTIWVLLLIATLASDWDKDDIWIFILFVALPFVCFMMWLFN